MAMIYIAGLATSSTHIMESENTATAARPTIVFSPAQLLGQYRNSLQSNFDGKTVWVSGFYEPGQGKDYNGVYYDGLKDENDKEKLTIIVSQNERSGLKKGGFYTLAGSLQKGAITLESTMRMQMKVFNVTGYDQTRQQFSESDYEVFRQRMDQGFFDVEGMLIEGLRADNPTDIAIITGNESVVDQDFYKSLGVCRSKYNITVIRSNMMHARELINAISNIDVTKYSLLVFMRGGGSGLEVFNDMNLCRTAIESGLPFVSAIGHENDNPALARLSDRSFSTPTAFGNFLSLLAGRVNSERQELEDKKLSLAFMRSELQAKEQTIKQLELQQQQQKTESAKQTRTLLLIISGVVILLIVLLLRK